MATRSARDKVNGTSSVSGVGSSVNGVGSSVSGVGSSVNGVGSSVNGVGSPLNGVGSSKSSLYAPAVNPGTATRSARRRADREGVEHTFKQFAPYIQVATQPRPNLLNGATGGSHEDTASLVDELRQVRWTDVKAAASALQKIAKGEQVIDDKTMLLERIAQLISRLPTQSKTRAVLTDKINTALWNSLDHPPKIYLGDEYMYRKADGSYNNILYPWLGASNTNYARSAAPRVVTPAALPDPGLIFDSIMKRTKYRKHPNNNSSVLFYWATIIVHEVFWTDPKDTSKNKTTSYLDLSWLYGSDQDMQNSMRTFRDGRLKPDAYADRRLLNMAPGTSVILIMFNRFHNYAAENLAAINEGGRFTPPADHLDGEEKAAAWAKYDEDLFQTARLVTSGLYINIIVADYVRNVMNMNRADTSWTIDATQNTGVEVDTAVGAERGTGNAVSAEFNVLYRWHSCISERDEQWLKKRYHAIFGKPTDDLSMAELFAGLAKYEKTVPEDPGERVFGGYERGADGKFSDDDLVDCISSAIEDCGGAFGARNVPPVLRAVEIMNILQGRKWHMACLNEFRKHFNLKPYETFEDISSDPEVADQLRHLYGHPDFVELYPGIVAEDYKEPMSPGTGVGVSYTVSRVLLSDAVVLIRGDRFYTTDYNPRHLTSWGFNEVQRDLDVDGGCSFYKLFLRAFPNHFRHNSVYAHGPMFIPSENHKILTGIGKAHLYDYSRPTYVSPHTEIASQLGARHVFESPSQYQPAWRDGLSELLGASTSGFAGRKLFHFGRDDDLQAHTRVFYRQTTERLLAEKSFVLAGQRQVDIIRDVGNVAPVHLAARVFGLPLQSAANPGGAFTEQELYMALAVLRTSTAFHLDPVKRFQLLQPASAVADQLGQLVEDSVRRATGFSLRGLLAPAATDPLASYGADVARGLAKSGISARDIALGAVVPAACSLVPTHGELLALAVDFYLSPAGEPHRDAIHHLAAAAPSREADAQLLGYALEGARLGGSSGGYRTAAAADTIRESDGTEVRVRAGDRIFARYADVDKTVDPRRDGSAYAHLEGLDAAAEAGLLEMFRAVFRRRNVRRVAGLQGELKKLVRPDGMVEYLREDWGAKWPFPTTMRITWDE